MTLASLSVRDLEYVVAVAEHGHFGRAAEACAVSQPALSAQIRKVENVLGLRLFERTRRRVLVTPLGAEIAAQGRVVLQEVRKLFETAGGQRGPLVGPFRLGVIATLGPYLLPHLLGPLRRRFPRLELFLREGLTRVLLQELRSGALDAVLAAAPIVDTALSVEPLFEEPFLLALPARHPLNRKPRVGTADLRADEMVLLEDGHCLRDQALEVCPNDRGGGRTPRLQATSLETLRHMVATGSGYSLMPALAAANDVGRLIRYRRLVSPSPGRSVVLVWRRQFTRAADIESLCRLVREHLPPRVRPHHPPARPRAGEAGRLRIAAASRPPAARTNSSPRLGR